MENEDRWLLEQKKWERKLLLGLRHELIFYRNFTTLVDPTPIESKNL